MGIHSDRAALAVAHDAADLARVMIRERTVPVVRFKSDRDPVSDLDLDIEHAVRHLLAERSPGVGFLGEETGGSHSGRAWVLDPIDGTANLIHGIPLCAVALALIEDGRTRAAVVDLPFLGVRYSAVLGGGADRDGASIAASGCTNLDAAIVAVGDFATGTDAGSRNRRRIEIVSHLAERAQRVRMLGSAAIDLVWVAEGLLDACVMLSNKPWDTAAGVLIAREAGALTSDADGRPHELASASTVAAAPGIAAELETVLVATANDHPEADER